MLTPEGVVSGALHGTYRHVLMRTARIDSLSRTPA
jgi:hypothetical protein